MMDPWEEFESAQAATGEQRRQGLRRLRSYLEGAGPAGDPSVQELLACVVAQLVDAESPSLEEAENAVEAAQGLGRWGWPNYYMAEAAHRVGRPAQVLKAVAQIPSSFFERRGLVWRNVRLLELKIMAKLRMGDLRAASELAADLSAILAAEGDNDFYPYPSELVGELVDALSTIVGILRTLGPFVDLTQVAAKAQGDAVNRILERVVGSGHSEGLALQDPTAVEYLMRVMDADDERDAPR